MEEWRSIGFIGVDSGQMMLVDPCYVLADDSGRSRPTYEDLLAQYDYTKPDPGAIMWEIPGGAVVAHSGFGDGEYEVLIREVDAGLWGKRVAEMKIIFIDDEEFSENG